MFPRLIIFVLASVLAGFAEEPAESAGNPALHEVQVAVANRVINLSLVVFAERNFLFHVINNAGDNDTAKYPDLATAMKANGCAAGCNGGFFSRKPFAPVGGMI